MSWVEAGSAPLEAFPGSVMGVSLLSFLFALSAGAGAVESDLSALCSDSGGVFGCPSGSVLSSLFFELSLAFGLDESAPACSASDRGVESSIS